VRLSRRREHIEIFELYNPVGDNVEPLPILSEHPTTPTVEETTPALSCMRPLLTRGLSSLGIRNSQRWSIATENNATSPGIRGPNGSFQVLAIVLDLHDLEMLAQVLA